MKRETAFTLAKITLLSVHTVSQLFARELSKHIEENLFLSYSKTEVLLRESPGF